MNSFIKKTLQFGVGSLYIVREKFDGTFKSLKKEGVFNEKESKKVVEEVLEKTKKQVNEATQNVKETVKKVVDKGEDVLKSKNKSDKVAAEVEVESKPARNASQTDAGGPKAKKFTASVKKSKKTE